MKLYNHMYVSGIEDKKVIKTLKKMKKRRDLPQTIYCITLPMFRDGILEIYEYNELRQQAYEDLAREPFVIGITSSQAEAYELVRQIVDEVFKNTGTFHVGRYLASYDWG